MSTDHNSPTDDVDPEALLDQLVAADVLREEADGALLRTEAFEDEFDLYEQTYGDVDEERFVRAVAAAFDLDQSTAAERIEELGVTREEFVAYMALYSFLDDPPSTEPLTVMAQMVADLDVVSPVPDEMLELSDEDYEAFIDDHGDAAVFVWRTGCDPCEGLKEDLPDVRAALPDSVAVAGVDGDAVPDLRAAFEVTSAPTLLLFRDGSLAETVVGRYEVHHYREYFDR
ncbi:MAG: thioredoxin family protein, partial [Haloglomus sp.]